MVCAPELPLLYFSARELYFRLTEFFYHSIAPQQSVAVFYFQKAALKMLDVCFMIPADYVAAFYVVSAF